MFTRIYARFEIIILCHNNNITFILIVYYETCNAKYLKNDLQARASDYFTYAILCYRVVWKPVLAFIPDTGRISF